MEGGIQPLELFPTKPEQDADNEHKGKGLAEDEAQDRRYRQSLIMATKMDEGKWLLLNACTSRILRFQHVKRHHPADNSYDFWRGTVSEYFHSSYTGKICTVAINNSPAVTADAWTCFDCGSKLKKSKLVTHAQLPWVIRGRLNKITDELLYLDLGLLYVHAGLFVVDYDQVVRESVRGNKRLVGEGKLRVTFSTDLKIMSWEFCTHKKATFLEQPVLPPANQVVGNNPVAADQQIPMDIEGAPLV